MRGIMLTLSISKGRTRRLTAAKSGQETRLTVFRESHLPHRAIAQKPVSRRLVSAPVMLTAGKKNPQIGQRIWRPRGAAPLEATCSVRRDIARLSIEAGRGPMTVLVEATFALCRRLVIPSCFEAESAPKALVDLSGRREAAQKAQ